MNRNIMTKYFSNNKIVFLIIIAHILFNFDFYFDSFYKLGSRKINYERISPKGRYRVEFYKLNEFITLITKYDHYGRYAKVYDKKNDKYIYESPVYDGFDCGTTWFQHEMRPTIFNFCFETQRLELEE
ncbi:hypothetical protein JCM14713_02970 [Desulfomicrobium salsuginis]